jgi:5-hydroxyisourate hydrolase
MITTHILDLSSGKPAPGVRVTLSRVDDASRSAIGSGVTDGDGRLRDFGAAAGKVDSGVFELTFETGAYFRSRGIEPFHPRVTVIVEISDGAQHYHVPLLLSPFGYTTYRGS